LVYYCYCTGKFGKPVSAAAGFFYGILKKTVFVDGKAFV